MAAICQFHQHGHCKFADKCVKIHTSATCDSFPCQDPECPKRHPRMCKYYAMYGRCVYAERCSFLHFSFSGGEQTARHGVHAIEQEMYELREEVKNLREEVKHMLGMVKDLKEEIDVDRVRKQGNDREEVKKLRIQIEKHKEGTSSRLSDAYENQKRLLEMVRDLKEEFEVEKATRVSHAGTARSKEQTVEEGHEGDSVACLGFPCMDTSCLRHYTVEGNIRRGQAADRAREEEGHSKNRVKGDKTGRKHHQGIGKSVAPGRTPGGYQGHGRGQN
jgi:hypothetical protein